MTNTSDTETITITLTKLEAGFIANRLHEFATRERPYLPVDANEALDLCDRLADLAGFSHPLRDPKWGKSNGGAA